MLRIDSTLLTRRASLVITAILGSWNLCGRPNNSLPTPFQNRGKILVNSNIHIEGFNLLLVTYVWESFLFRITPVNIIIRFNLPSSAVRHARLFVHFVGIILSVFRALDFFYICFGTFSADFSYLCPRRRIVGNLRKTHERNGNGTAQLMCSEGR